MKIRYIDLFAGIGGFRVAANNVFKKHKIASECVFSSEIDEFAQKMYMANFGEKPFGDISQINGDIPQHDILFAGFPCQPFSIIGNGKGFEDIRGTLFFEIVRILRYTKPKAFILENVKRLKSHQDGYTFKKICGALRKLGYWIDYKVLNALDYGLPQKRERIFIIGYFKPVNFTWPPKKPKMKPLDKILEKNVDKKYFASSRIINKRKSQHKSQHNPSIWHENKAGNICSYPYSCALRAGASHNYLLVNGERRLTPREMLRLQGFPNKFKIVVPDSQARKQAGNAVPVNVVQAVLESFAPILKNDLSKKP
ncbi:MAG TPA: DNA (cytosine-5-)-methyltransferase [Nitrospirae bacterium]|nr:DNA (cytosine-5-)-methyltransferase [Nitrospirota bacterium]